MAEVQVERSRSISAAVRAFASRRAPVLPLEAYRKQPRAYYVWSASVILMTTAGIVVGSRFMQPAIAAVVAGMLIAHSALVPAVRTPQGGTLTFPTAILLSTGFLYDPATAFVGVTIGWTIGHTAFHRRELWRGMSNALILALGVSSGAATLSILRAHLSLPLVIAIGPVLLLAVNRITNVALLSLLAYVRWSMAPWSYFVARIRGSAPDQLVDILWLLPVTVGSVLLPVQWWWTLVLISLPLSCIDASLMAQIHGWQKAADPVISDTLAEIEDPRVQAVTTHLSRGAALIDPSGHTFLISPAALSLCGLRQAPANPRLHELFAEDDGPLIDRLLAKAGLNPALQCAEVRPRMSRDRIVFLTVANRLADSRLRGFVVTIQEPTNEDRRWRALLQYANKTFAAPLIRALEEERRRVGQEVDSSIRQTLALLQLALDRPGSTLSPAPHDLLRRAMAAARSIQRTLAPPELDDFGLLATVKTYANDIRLSGVEITIEATLRENSRFDPDVELVAYRVIQWVVENVVRQGAVKRATVQLSVSDGILRIIVDTDASLDMEAARGVGSMTQIEGRVSLIGGRVTVNSQTGNGTRVFVELPVNTAGVMAVAGRSI